MFPQYTASTVARFWAKVNKTDTCWLWTASGNKIYGDFELNRKHVPAHRMAWMLTHGDIPDGLIVCHKCDVPRCVNPDHLFLGTYADNAADMVAKGRSLSGDRNPSRLHPERRPRGERHHLRRHPELIIRGADHYRSRLTWQQVREIRRLRQTGISLPKLAKQFGVATSTVYSIVCGESWKEDAP